MTPFSRLALLAAATLYAVGLAVVSRWLGWISTGSIAAAGVVVALLVTLEFAPRSPAVSAEGLEAAGDPGADFQLRQRDRRDIERAAARAADDVTS